MAYLEARIQDLSGNILGTLEHPLHLQGSLTSVGEFGRIREGNLKSNEEVRFDSPASYSSTYSYVGVAETGSSTALPVWSVIRITYSATGRRQREQFRTNVSWDDRAIGWNN